MSAEKPQTWPRTEEGNCACPLCTAIRNGEAPPVETEPSEWLRRMGGMPAR